MRHTKCYKCVKMCLFGYSSTPSQCLCSSLMCASCVPVGYKAEEVKKLLFFFILLLLIKCEHWINIRIRLFCAYFLIPQKFSFCRNWCFSGKYPFRFVRYMTCNPSKWSQRQIPKPFIANNQKSKSKNQRPYKEEKSTFYCRIVDCSFSLSVVLFKLEIPTRSTHTNTKHLYKEHRKRKKSKRNNIMFTVSYVINIK